MRLNHHLYHQLIFSFLNLISCLVNIQHAMFALRDGTDYTVILPYPIGRYDIRNTNY